MASSITTSAIRIHACGGVEAMVYDTVELPALQNEQVLVEMSVAGINYIDTYHRTGLYKLPLPAILGREGSGVVSAVGSGVSRLKPGDRVVFFAGNAYAKHVIVDEKALQIVPQHVSLTTAAAVYLQGLTAHSFLTSVFPVSSSHTVLIHAAAGGVGALMVQMAKLKGATVIGTVGSAAKESVAKEAGCDHVLVGEDNFDEKVRALTNGKGVDAVFDGVGKTTYSGSLKSLKKRGMLVLFGNASGPVPPIDPLSLTAAGSVVLTRPTLGHFIEDVNELVQRCNDMWAWIKDGKLKVRVAKEFPLQQAAEAHTALESRQYAGKILLRIKEDA